MPILKKILKILLKIAKIIGLIFAGSVALIIALLVFKTNVVFSEVEGVLTQGGQPLEGVEIEQYYRFHWEMKEFRATTVTDKEGKFRFPERTEHSILSSIFPHQPVVDQIISFRYQGIDYKGWQFTKMNYEAYTEIPKATPGMYCELDRYSPENIQFSKVCQVAKDKD